jgi:hypothetical protein
VQGDLPEARRQQSQCGGASRSRTPSALNAALDGRAVLPFG